MQIFFSDLIYLVKFQTYFKFTDHHKSKFAKPGPPKNFQKKNNFFIIFDALSDKDANNPIFDIITILNRVNLA